MIRQQLCHVRPCRSRAFNTNNAALTMLTLAWSLRHNTRRIRIWGGCRKCRATPVHPTQLTALLGARGECSPRVHSHSYHHHHHYHCHYYYCYHYHQHHYHYHHLHRHHAHYYHPHRNHAQYHHVMPFRLKEIPNEQYGS
jgi:hypothetical protein